MQSKYYDIYNMTQNVNNNRDIFSDSLIVKNVIFDEDVINDYKNIHYQKL